MNYSNIELIPNYSTTRSRATDCDTSIAFFGHKFRLPVVPSNMPAVIDVELAEKLARAGYFYILHRFMDYARIIKFARQLPDELPVSISIGVKSKDYELVERLLPLKPDFITIDVAHGHSILVKEMATFVKAKLPDTILIAGNVGTRQAIYDLKNWGVDVCKLFIGTGSVCETYKQTGFKTSPVETLLECADIMPVIADGGIANNGDIAKALVLGADMVMVGGLLAGHLESPGKVITADGKQYKYYFGNASAMRGNTHNIEGTDVQVELKGSIFDTLNEMVGHLQSAISYAGGKNLSAFNNVKYRKC